MALKIYKPHAEVLWVSELDKSRPQLGCCAWQAQNDISRLGPAVFLSLSQKH
jgi:hypothetical protein